MENLESKTYYSLYTSISHSKRSLKSSKIGGSAQLIFFIYAEYFIGPVSSTAFISTFCFICWEKMLP